MATHRTTVRVSTATMNLQGVLNSKLTPLVVKQNKYLLAKEIEEED